MDKSYEFRRRALSCLLCGTLVLTATVCGTGCGSEKGASEATESVVSESADALETEDMLSGTELAVSGAPSNTDNADDSDSSALAALALENIYDEDENEYGNSIGNVYNQGMLVNGVSGATYFYDMYDGQIYMILEDGIVAFLLAEENMFQLNYLDGVLYGVDLDGAVVSYVVAEEKSTVLREAADGVEGLQLVNDRLYFIDSGETASTDRDYPDGDYTVGSVYGPKLTQSQLNDVADAVQEFLDKYDMDSMDDYTKVLTAHDYLCEICSYASDWSVNGANTAWGALVYHEAQCSGYARAMKALCDAMGVGCYYVHASDDASNPSHQWNVCCVDGNWYIVDVQCNDSSGFKAYFLVSDATYEAVGMRWDTSSVPECAEDYQGE